MFKYLEENLEIIKNPDEVNYIRPYKLEKGGSALFAITKANEAVQLTQPQGAMSFPWESINELSQELGKIYFRNFAVIAGNYAINRKHLNKINYVNSNDKEVSVLAFFDNENEITLFDVKKNYFFKKLKAEIELKTQLEFENETKENENIF